MTKSELYPHGTSGREWFVVVTWIPTLGQTGSHVFCFTAVDNIGYAKISFYRTFIEHKHQTDLTLIPMFDPSYTNSGFNFASMLPMKLMV